MKPRAKYRNAYVFPSDDLYHLPEFPKQSAFAKLCGVAFWQNFAQNEDAAFACHALGVGGIANPAIGRNATENIRSHSSTRIMTHQQAVELTSSLANKNILFEDGLTDTEIQAVEEKFGFVFPPDLRIFLQNALPVSDGFYNWRLALSSEETAASLHEMLDWPLDGILFDMEHNGFWADVWGEPPTDLPERFSVARRMVPTYPKLIPVCSHRYIPESPHVNGNPVYSVYQTDIIYYGYDLANYLAEEFRFGLSDQFQILQKPKHPVAFWDWLVERNNTPRTPPMYQADLTQAKTLLTKWLQQSLDEKGNRWLAEKRASFATPQPVKDVFLAFGMAPRMVGKQPLQLQQADLRDAEKLRHGLTVQNWTTDQAARILMLLMLPHDDVAAYTKTLNQLFTTADVGELTALYLALPLLPHPEALRSQASEGVRTNMGVVFNALALDNPYPGDYMDEPAWNQLVLKAVFVGSPLHRMVRLDERANATLARILRDFAHERWAAGRPVSPEIWRLVTPFVSDSVLPDARHLFEKGSETEQETAALMAVRSGHPGLLALATEKRPDLVKNAQNGEIGWPV